MTAIENTTVISAEITPGDDRDTFATHYAEYGKGGLKVVETLADLNDITDARKEFGMWVNVLDSASNQTYVRETWAWESTYNPLDESEGQWEKVSFSQSGVTGDFTDLDDTPSNYLGESGKIVAVEDDGNGNGNGSGLTFIDIPSGVSNFIELDDTPGGYGTSGQVATSDGAQVIWQDAASGGVDNWEPVEGLDIELVDQELSDNTTISDVTNGVSVSETVGNGNEASAATLDTFTLTGVEQGWYFKIVDVDEPSVGGGYYGFTDGVADWYNVGGAFAGCQAYYDTDHWEIQASIFGSTDGGGWNYSSTQIQMNAITGLEACTSVKLDGLDATVKIWFNDGSNTSASTPDIEFTQTLSSDEASDLSTHLDRAVVTCYSATGSTEQYDTPDLQYDNVTIFTETGTIDKNSYPTGREGKAYILYQMDKELDSDIGPVNNGWMVVFDDNGDLVTGTVYAVDHVKNTDDVNWSGDHVFTESAEFQGAFIAQTPLNSKYDSAVTFDAYRKYQFTLAGSNSATATLPVKPTTQVSYSEAGQYLWVDVDCLGRSTNTLTVSTEDGSNFYIDGEDSGSSDYVLSPLDIIKFQTSAAGNNDPQWEVITLSYAGQNDTPTKIGGDTTYITADDSGDNNITGVATGQMSLEAQSYHLYGDSGGIQISDTSGDKRFFVDSLAAKIVTDTNASVLTQTEDMTGGTPDEYIATKKYVDENAGGINDTDLYNYIADSRISLTTANGYDLIFKSGGSSAGAVASFEYHYTDIKKNPYSTAAGRLRFYDAGTLATDDSVYSGAIYSSASNNMRFEDGTSATYLNLSAADLALVSGTDITLTSGTGGNIALNAGTSGIVSLSGTETTVNAEPISDSGIATKKYVDDNAGIQFTLGQSAGTTEITGVNSRVVISALTDELIAFQDWSLEEIRTYQVTADGWTQVGNSYSFYNSNNSYDNAMCALSSTRIVMVMDSSSNPSGGSALGDNRLQTLDWDGTDWSLIGNMSGLTGRNNVFLLTKLTETTVCCVDSDTMYHLTFDGTDWTEDASLSLSNFYSTKASLATLNSTTVAMYYGGDGIDDQYRVYEWSGSSWSLSYAVDTDVVYSRGMTQLETDYIIYNENRTQNSLIKFYWNGTTLEQIGDAVAGTSTSAVMTLTNLNEVTIQTLDSVDDNTRLYQYKNDATRNSVFDLYYSDEDFKIFSQEDVKLEADNIDLKAGLEVSLTSNNDFIIGNDTSLSDIEVVWTVQNNGSIQSAGKGTQFIALNSTGNSQASSQFYALDDGSANKHCAVSGFTNEDSNLANSYLEASNDGSATVSFTAVNSDVSSGNGQAQSSFSMTSNEDASRSIDISTDAFNIDLSTGLNFWVGDAADISDVDNATYYRAITDWGGPYITDHTASTTTPADGVFQTSGTVGVATSTSTGRSVWTVSMSGDGLDELLDPVHLSTNILLAVNQDGLVESTWSTDSLIKLEGAEPVVTATGPGAVWDTYRITDYSHTNNTGVNFGVGGANLAGSNTHSAFLIGHMYESGTSTPQILTFGNVSLDSETGLNVNTESNLISFGTSGGVDIIGYGGIAFQSDAGDITVDKDPSVALGIATKQYVDSVTGGGGDSVTRITYQTTNPRNITIHPNDSNADPGYAEFADDSGDGTGKNVLNLHDMRLKFFDDAVELQGDIEATSGLLTIYGQTKIDLDCSTVEVKQDPTTDLGVATKQYVDNATDSDLSVVNVTTTTYTLTASDAGKLVRFNNASTITFTLANSVATEGVNFSIEQVGAGIVDFTGTAVTAATRSNVDGHTETRGTGSLVTFVCGVDGTFTYQGATQ